MLGTAPTAVQNEFEHLGSCELTDLRICFCSAVVIAHGSWRFTASHPFFHWSLLLHRGSVPYLLLSNGPFSSSLFSASLLSPFSVASYGRSAATKFGASVSLAHLWRLPMLLDWTGTSSLVPSFFAWNQLLLSSNLLLVATGAALLCCGCTHTYSQLLPLPSCFEKGVCCSCASSIEFPSTLFGVACRCNFFKVPMFFLWSCWILEEKQLFFGGARFFLSSRNHCFCWWWKACNVM